MEVARLAMQAGQAGVYEEEARFGRTLGLSLSHRMDREPSVSSLEQVTTSSTNFQSLGLGLTQRLGTGGKVELTVRQNRSASNAGYRTVNPVFGTDMELALTQPLQRGRGKVNRAALNIARNDLESAEVNLEGHVKELTANIKWAYWDMAFAYENLKVKRQLLEGALRVMETVTARVEMGEESRNSILLAELGVAQREEDIIVAQDHVLDAEGQLKVLMGLAARAMCS